MSESKSLVLVLASLMVCLAAPLAPAAFTPIDDFEALSLAPISGQNGWYASSSAVVTADPADPANRVLAVATDSSIARKPVSIGNGTVATLFLRFRFPDQLNYSFGMSDIAGAVEINDFEVELNQTNASADLRINDGGTYDVLRTLAASTWHNLWMVIDNSADCTYLYLNSAPLAGAAPADQLTLGLQDAFTFRNGSAADLIRFFVKTGGGGSPNQGPLYLDDLYLDQAGLNLANPVPEPMTLALLLAALAAARSRRMRR